MKRSLKLLLVIILLNVLNACEKESSDTIIGTWVSENKADTLYIINNHLFNKSLQDGIRHTFEYSLSKDSIIIQYKGPNKILVFPSANFYRLDGRELMIDFSNHCYGFEHVKETFLKQ
jgi:hypothetical protein